MPPGQSRRRVINRTRFNPVPDGPNRLKRSMGGALRDGVPIRDKASRGVYSRVGVELGEKPQLWSAGAAALLFQQLFPRMNALRLHRQKIAP